MQTREQETGTYGQRSTTEALHGAFQKHWLESGQRFASRCWERFRSSALAWGYTNGTGCCEMGLPAPMALACGTEGDRWASVISASESSFIAWVRARHVHPIQHAGSWSCSGKLVLDCIYFWRQYHSLTSAPRLDEVPKTGTHAMN